MQNQYIQQTSSYTLNIGSNNVNDEGIYTFCSLLQEMARANDGTVMEAFDTTSISAIHVTHYSVDFLGQAVKGDALRIESTYAMDVENNLYVQVRVSKQVKRMRIAVCAGNFTFINTNRVKTTIQNADTVLA